MYLMREQMVSYACRIFQQREQRRGILSGVLAVLARIAEQSGLSGVLRGFSYGMGWVGGVLFFRLTQQRHLFGRAVVGCR